MLDYLYSALANPTVAPDYQWPYRNSGQKSAGNTVKESGKRTSSYGSIAYHVKERVAVGTENKYSILSNGLDTITEEEEEDDEGAVSLILDKWWKQSSGWRRLDNGKHSEDEPLVVEHSSKKILSSKKIKKAGKRIRKALQKSISYLAMGLANMTTFVLVPTNIPSPMYHYREFNPYY